MRIAIIGSGIAGLATAYFLHKKHDICVYDKNNYIGGHSRTVFLNEEKKALDVAFRNKLINGKADLKKEKKQADNIIPIDTGFIVFNHRNYPKLSAFFQHLEVPVQKSEMSFGVSIENGWLEYGTLSYMDLFAQKRNFLRPKYLTMLLDILRFNKKAKAYVDTRYSMDELIDKLKLGSWFRDYYLLAMGSAIWSTPLATMKNFPVSTFIRFFENHGLLTINNRPQWYTVKGGSIEYVSRLIKGFRDKIKPGFAVTKVIRRADAIEVHDSGGNIEFFDRIVFACHADHALSMLQNPSRKEQELLGCFSFTKNKIVLHSDDSFMQKRRKAWSSWVYLSANKKEGHPLVCLSYWVNNLQNIQSNRQYFVTLNAQFQPQQDIIYDKHIFEHPRFDQVSIDAQKRLEEIQGQDRIWYAGAWTGYGFHEDGLKSALRIADEFQLRPSWI